jgi:predicted RNase H-like HicB family nuclease
MKTYFAIVHKDEDSAVGIVFPDLPGCFSAGDTYDEAIANAHEALRLYADAERRSGRALPPPSTFEALYADREIRAEARGAPFVGIRLDGPARVGAKVKKRDKRRQAAR